MSELNREQIIKALKDMNIIGVSPVAIRNAIALINELTQANEQLSESYDHLEKTKDELISERARLTEENERLRVELEKRPPRLVITKLQKGNNDENSKDTVALQKREADHYI